MSRSRKKPVIKDRGYMKNIYWKIVRKAIKSAIKSGKQVLPLPKEVVNDYSYCDYVIDLRYLGITSQVDDSTRQWQKNYLENKF